MGGAVMAVTLNATTSSGLVTTADNSGQIAFQSNGTQFNPTLISGTSQASTSGTSIDFTSIPSWVKRITVMLQGISTNGTNDYIVQLGTGATPTYTTSGYLGGCSTQTGGTVVNNSSGFDFSCSTVAAGIWHGTLIITNITGNSWTQFGTIARSDTAAMRYSAGSVPLSAVLTAVRITTVGGTDTFDAGTINILYE